MQSEVNKELESIGLRLKELRLAKGFTSYRSFALQCDMEPKIYWRIENGQSDFKYSSLKRILKTLDMGADEFYRDLKLESR